MPHLQDFNHICAGIMNMHDGYKVMQIRYLLDVVGQKIPSSRKCCLKAIK